MSFNQRPTCVPIAVHVCMYVWRSRRTLNFKNFEILHGSVIGIGLSDENPATFSICKIY